MMDWCLRQSYNDDFDWSFGSSCTETEQTGPCNEQDLKKEVQCSFSNAAFKEKTQQHPNISNSSLLAVDGDINTRSELGPASSPWWKVDLGREGMVTGVRLALNVTNHGIDRGLVNITVTNKTGDSLVCASIDEDDVSGDPVHLVTSCDEPLLGRYVQVEMHVAEDCSKANCEFTVFLYEVEVMLEQSAGFYYIEASLPRVKGERARLETQYILPRFNCLAFSYHMRGGHMGKLSVYLKSYKNSELILLWRLVREQSTEWQRGEIPIQSNNTFKIIFEGIVGVGEEGDVAIDAVMFTRNNNCSFIPDVAHPIIFEGDHSWGSYPEGLRLSTKSFLFRFEKEIGQASEELVVGIGQVLKVIQWRTDRGPVFGGEELALSSDMRQANTSDFIWYTYGSTQAYEKSLLRENNVYVHAVEVLVTGGEFA
ncbi:hypothetical protein OS493_034174 [Desmophyllum pertusum]|uniref:MAM domain-containing protein n=1 Tax=Desmophyllum pertusum TaxID=174260 RepID=A0A9X0D8Q6_9CNID|nr:hypothetical protein OS493_034174 [Desmophyllum pertusum]